MNRAHGTRAAARRASAGPLRVFRPEESGGREVRIHVLDPGWYRLRMWTPEEWSGLAPGEVPAGVMVKGGLYYLLDVPPDQG